MRDYKAEYQNYDGTPAVKKKRAERNKARRMLEREGAVKKGDGKDVDHITPSRERWKHCPQQSASQVRHRQQIV